MLEFATKGYSLASLNTICEKSGASKGLIYHYFKDKNELYLTCVKQCFDLLTMYLKNNRQCFIGTLEQKLQLYFDARQRFFIENPLYLGIFADDSFSYQTGLVNEVSLCRKEFDELNISILTEFLTSQTIRKDLKLTTLVEDFRVYLDFLIFVLKKSVKKIFLLRLH